MDYITGTAVLEFGPAETLPLVGAMSPVYPVSADRAPLPWPAHPREKPGFSTSARYFPSETDCLLEEAGFEPSVPRKGDDGFETAFVAGGAETSSRRSKAK